MLFGIIAEIFIKVNLFFKMKRTSERIIKLHLLVQFVSNFSDNSVSSFTVSNMVNRSIISPVKENNISCHRGITSVTEPAFTFKPLHTVRTKRKFRNDPTLNATALVCTPGHKAATPLYPTSKAIPAPVGCSAFSFLRCCHLND